MAPAPRPDDMLRHRHRRSAPSYKILHLAKSTRPETALIHGPTASEAMAVAGGHLPPVPSLTPSKALTMPLARHSRRGDHSHAMILDRHPDCRSLVVGISRHPSEQNPHRKLCTQGLLTQAPARAVWPMVSLTIRVAGLSGSRFNHLHDGVTNGGFRHHHQRRHDC